MHGVKLLLADGRHEHAATRVKTLSAETLSLQCLIEVSRMAYRSWLSHLSQSSLSDVLSPNRSGETYQRGETSFEA